MDPSTSAVLYSFLLLVSFVLLPLIPSVVIYWLFPDTKVAASGPFANLTLKASGAFAAYLIILLVVNSRFGQVYDTISATMAPTWTVRGKVKFIDKDNNEINKPRLLKALKIMVDPPTLQKGDREFWFKVPDLKNHSMIVFQIPGFWEKKINVQNIDPANPVVDLDEILIRQIDTIENAYEAGGSLTEDTSGGPGKERR